MGSSLIPYEILIVLSNSVKNVNGESINYFGQHGHFHDIDSSYP